MTQNPRTRIAGPTYPLLAELRAAITAENDAYTHALPHAQALRRAHLDNALSTQSVVHHDGTWIGPIEDHAQLATAQPVDYLIVRDGQTDRDLAAELCRDEKARVRAARQRIAAAEAAHPMATIVLAILADQDMIDWDTDESISRAAWRLSLDAAQQTPVLASGVSPAAVFTQLLNLLGCVTTGDRYADGRGYAQAWLARRREIRARLAGRGITWGGSSRRRTSAAVADHLCIARSTWRAYVNRQEAPADDADGMWLPATVDAYRMLTQRGPQWWGTGLR